MMERLFFLWRCMECRRGLAMRKLCVRLPVCLSVKRVDCDKTEKRCVQIFIPYERSFSLVFWEEEWLVGATPSTWNFGSTGPRWSEIADFEPIFARRASAVTPRSTQPCIPPGSLNRVPASAGVKAGKSPLPGGR